MTLCITALFSFLLSTILVYRVIRLAVRKSWFDGHDERKIHVGEIPRLGGVGFVAAYIMMAFAITFMNGSSSFGLSFLPVLIAMTIIFIFGVIDDFKPLTPRFKLMIQSFAALLVLSGGFAFSSVSSSTMGIDLPFGIMKYPLTFLWIIGITNALNLIDGVDGLAGGVSLIASLTYAIVFTISGNERGAVLCFALAGVIAGFLVFNLPLPRAKIFMGDCGSQFLGFMLALFPLMDSGKGSINLAVPFAAAVLLIPIGDTFAAIWRRTRDGVPMTRPDRAHTHHKLMNIGLKSWGVDIVLWSLQAIVGVFVILSTFTDGWHTVLMLGGAYASCIAFFAFLHFYNRAVNLKRGLGSQEEN